MEIEEIIRSQNSQEIINQDPEFFEVFLPDRISHQLFIPPDFIKYFDEKIPEAVVLKDLSGRVWHVDVKQGENHVILANGWNKFVKDKNLKLGEFIVFRYNRMSPLSTFTVRIFGLSACKKEDKVCGKVRLIRVKDEQESYTDSTPIRKCQ